MDADVDPTPTPTPTADEASIRAELAAIDRGVLDYERLTLEVERAKAEVQASVAAEAVARTALEKETADVHALDGGPQRVLRLLGRHRDRAEIDRERDEQQQADLVLQQATARVARAREAVDAARAALGPRPGDLRLRRTAVLDSLEQVLLSTPSLTASALAEVGAAIAEAAPARARLQGVVDLAAEASALLADAQSLLIEARGLADTESFTRATVLSEAVKYDAVDRADALLRHADDLVRQLATQVRDLPVSAPGVHLVVEGGTRLLDSLGLGFFSGLRVRDQIIEAEQTAGVALRDVERLRTRLESALLEASSRLEELTTRRARILEP